MNSNKNSISLKSINQLTTPILMWPLWNSHKNIKNFNKDHRQPNCSCSLCSNREMKKPGNYNKNQNTRRKSYSKELQGFNNKFKTMRNILNTSMKKKFKNKTFKKNTTLSSKNWEKVKKETLRLNCYLVM